MTVQRGDFFGLSSDKIFYCCRFPYQIKRTFGGYDLKSHENFISREVEAKKCVICNKNLTSINANYFHFYRHFSKSKNGNNGYYTKKINPKDYKKYVCVKFETIKQGSPRYKGYPIALMKMSKNNDKITILNQTGVFKLVLNNFLVNFTNKSVFLNYKHCQYKISEIDDKCC